MLTINLSDIAILKLKGPNYCCIDSLISKNEALNVLQNADQTRKAGSLLIKKYGKNENIYKNGKKLIW